MNSDSNGLFDSNDTILLIVDMQEKLLPLIPQAPDCTQNIVKLMKLAAILNIPTVLTEQENLGATAPEILNEMPQLKPIRKLQFSCFGSTEFSTHLHSLKRNSLIITGIEAHICVAQTAIEGRAAYAIQLVADAVASRLEANKRIALERLRQLGVTVSSTEMVIYELLRQAGTEPFRMALRAILK